MRFVLIMMVIGGILAGAGFYFFNKNRESTQLNDVIIAEAIRGPFDHIVLEQGELESTSNVDVVCKVRARGGAAGTAILWVIEEGSIVKEGDKLVELDSSALLTSLKEKRLAVIAAEAAVAAAVALVEQQVISRQEYLEGLYETEQRLIQSEMAIAEQALRKAQLALESTQRLVAKGLVKSLQLEADQFAVANNRTLLDSAENRLKVLQNLTRQKMLVQFDSAINSAEAQLAAANGALDEEQSDQRFLEKQIDFCLITAPSGGVVIHANEYNGRGGGAEFVVEAGANVRERQTIIRLPDPDRMQVRANVNESRITLIRTGMPAKIRVDAINNLELLGRVGKVNRYAEPGSWMSTSIKEYATTIEIITPPESIRTGMTAEVQIFVEQLPEATQIPIQAVYEHGGKTYSLVKTGPQTFETRAVTIGATNEKLATINSGINEGENVVLNLRQNLALLDLPKLAAKDNTELAKLSTESTDENLDGPSDASGPRGGSAEGRPGGGKPGGGSDGEQKGRGEYQKGASVPAGEKNGQRDPVDAGVTTPAATVAVNKELESPATETPATTPAATPTSAATTGTATMTVTPSANGDSDASE